MMAAGVVEMVGGANQDMRQARPSPSSNQIRKCHVIAPLRRDTAARTLTLTTTSDNIHDGPFCSSCSSLLKYHLFLPNYQACEPRVSNLITLNLPRTTDARHSASSPNFSIPWQKRGGKRSARKLFVSGFPYAHLPNHTVEHFQQCFLHTALAQ
jgi:hypothetical protein